MLVFRLMLSFFTRVPPVSRLFGSGMFELMLVMVVSVGR